MSHDDRTLHLLPTDPERARERASEERLADAPHAIQEWFDAHSDQLDQDRRLRLFLSDLAPGDDTVGDTAEGTAEDVLDDATPPPPQIGAWLAATAQDPDIDGRLLAFVDGLVPAPAVDTTLPPSTFTPAPLADATTRPSRWQRPAIAAALMLAAASLALQLVPTGPGSTGQVLQARAPQAPAADPVAPAAGDGVAVATPAPQPTTPASSAAPPAAPMLASQDALPATAGSIDPQPDPGADPALDAAIDPPAIDPPVEAIVVLTPDPAPPTAQEDLAPTPPPAAPLRTAGDILATASAWKGDVVPGLSLRLDRGFGHLDGTEAAPQLVLADGASVRVDLDRDVVASDFQTFTIRTLSATVQVVGTRYSVTTDDGRTVVSTRRGLVRVTCTDGRKQLVSAGQTAACDPHSDTRVLAHMEAMDRPPAGDGGGLRPEDQVAVLRRLMADSSPESFLATTQVMLDRAIADPGYRNALELVRIDAMCALGWAEPARAAARDLRDSNQPLERDRVEALAERGCQP